MSLFHAPTAYKEYMFYYMYQFDDDNKSTRQYSLNQHNRNASFEIIKLHVYEMTKSRWLTTF